jgi:uncharacterized membrane protein YphA (DoxX/SURF4 family)
MSRDRFGRKDYATGMVAVLVLGIALLPVGGVIIVGLLTPFIIFGLLIITSASLFARNRR